MNAIETFESNRSFLVALATKITGNSAAAEDLVNEAFLRWEKLDHEEIKNPRAMLATIVSRLAINEKNSARARREVLFEPRILSEMDFGDFGVVGKEDLSDALSAALQIVLNRLRPNERAVFLLREVFEFEYAEIAETLDESEVNCRQLLRRARAKIGAGGAVPHAPEHEAECVLEQFLAAAQTGEFEPLLAMMCEEPVLLRDAGNIGMPMPEPITGRAALVDFFKSLREQLDRASLTIRTVGEKYQLAELRKVNGELFGAFIATIRERRIETVRQISCPAKLGFLDRILRTEGEAI